MKVSELITELKELPQNAEIWVVQFEDWEASFAEPFTAISKNGDAIGIFFFDWQSCKAGEYEFIMDDEIEEVVA